jgi:peptide/nickel transport system permease protein
MSVVVSLAEDPPVRRRRTRFPVLLSLSVLIVAAVVVMAIAGNLIAPDNPSTQNLVLSLSTPSAKHLLGTDQLGRDVLSRLIVGSRHALLGPLAISLVSMVFGNLFGLLAGYRGGVIDAVIMRCVDLLWSIPAVLIVILAESAIGGGYWLDVALLSVLTIPFDTRVVRGATLEQAPRPYVEAAETIGVPAWRIMIRHIWPNVAPVAIANTFLVFAGSLVALASIAYLGLGIDPSTADWGVMLAQGEALLFENPVSVLAPGIMIVLTAASMNVIGDALYERLSRRGGDR